MCCAEYKIGARSPYPPHESKLSVAPCSTMCYGAGVSSRNKRLQLNSVEASAFAARTDNLHRLSLMLLQLTPAHHRHPNANRCANHRVVERTVRAQHTQTHGHLQILTTYACTEKRTNHTHTQTCTHMHAHMQRHRPIHAHVLSSIIEPWLDSHSVITRKRIYYLLK